MNRTNEYKEKYQNTLQRMFELFSFGWEREKNLEKSLDLAKDEFLRIKAIADSNSEISGICERSLTNIDNSLK